MAELTASLRATSRPRPAWRTDRVFFTTMSVLLAAVVFAGFAPTYYLRSAYQTEPLARVFQVHGAIFTAWMLLLVAQTSLVAGRRVVRIALHKASQLFKRQREVGHSGFQAFTSA